MATAGVQAQASLYEVTIENAELEEALEQRQSLKDKVSEARHNLKVVDEKVRPLIEALDIGDDTPVRIGRFVVTRRRVEGKPVSFETSDSLRLYIRPIEGLA